MGSVKADIRIGERAAEYVRQKAASDNTALSVWCRNHGFSYKIIYRWESEGDIPSVRLLQILCFSGADIKYILTGRHSYVSTRRN